jgi:hypothetical protein
MDLFAFSNKKLKNQRRKTKDDSVGEGGRKGSDAWRTNMAITHFHFLNGFQGKSRKQEGYKTQIKSHKKTDKVLHFPNVTTWVEERVGLQATSLHWWPIRGLPILARHGRSVSLTRSLLILPIIFRYPDVDSDTPQYAPILRWRRRIYQAQVGLPPMPLQYSNNRPPRLSLPM